jgi:hypothetical protein
MAKIRKRMADVVYTTVRQPLAAGIIHEGDESPDVDQDGQRI